MTLDLPDETCVMKEKRLAMVIGITGSFGSGKTTVAKMFKTFGAYIIDADRVCHSLMTPSKKAYKRILRHFGDSILRRNKAIDRHKLAEIVFKDKSKLKLLNALVHPEAISQIERIIRTEKKRKIIVIDAALLVESGFYKKIDVLVVVRISRRKQVKRLIQVKGMSKKDILNITRQQTTLRKKLEHSDFIIDNSGTKEETLFQVEKIWKTIRGGLCQ